MRGARGIIPSPPSTGLACSPVQDVARDGTAAEEALVPVPAPLAVEVP
jgi:hypothetical protein